MKANLVIDSELDSDNNLEDEVNARAIYVIYRQDGGQLSSQEFLEALKILRRKSFLNDIVQLTRPVNHVCEWLRGKVYYWCTIGDVVNGRWHDEIPEGPVWNGNIGSTLYTNFGRYYISHIPLGFFNCELRFDNTREAITWFKGMEGI